MPQKQNSNTKISFWIIFASDLKLRLPAFSNKLGHENKFETFRFFFFFEEAKQETAQLPP